MKRRQKRFSLSAATTSYRRLDSLLASGGMLRGDDSHLQETLTKGHFFYTPFTKYPVGK